MQEGVVGQGRKSIFLNYCKNVCLSLREHPNRAAFMECLGSSPDPNRDRGHIVKQSLYARQDAWQLAPCCLNVGVCLLPSFLGIPGIKFEVGGYAQTLPKKLPPTLGLISSDELRAPRIKMYLALFRGRCIDKQATNYWKFNN